MNTIECRKEGILLVISGPSGVGKGTVCSALRKKMPHLTYSVSVTTRVPREGEIDGVNYFFRSVDQFKAMIQHGELIEWAEYVGNYYGTPQQFVDDTIKSGEDIILEIDVQGAHRVKQLYPNGIFIFLIPPKIEDLRERILCRGTESEETLSHRLDVASSEFKQIHQYNYVVVNDEVDLACDRIQAIISAEHSRVDRFIMS